MRMKTVASGVLVALLLPGAVLAQATPKFEFGKAEEIKTVEWKAQVKGGFTLTSGNSQSRNGTFAATTSRKEGNNRLTLDLGAAYGKSNILTPVIDAPTNTITGVERRTVETTNNWLAKGRYDRFFTTNNSGYASAQAAADQIAGKAFFGGGQVGYSRQLYKSAMHLLVAELGYDLSYESYLSQPNKTLDPVTIHSARAFVGEALKLSDATGITANVEALFNLNKEGKALSADSGVAGVDAFKDTRVIGKVGLTTTLMKKLSAGFGLAIKYDQNPAPLPVPSGAPSGAAFAPGVQLFSETTDILAEVSVIYTLL